MIRIIVTLEREGVLGEGAQNDFKGFGKPRGAFRVGDVEAIVELGDAAPADAEIEPAVAHVVDGRHLFGDAQRIPQRKHLHRRADAHASGARGNGARHRHGGGQHRRLGPEVVLDDPDGVQAHGLGRIHLREQLVKGKGLPLIFADVTINQQAELHPDQPRCMCGSLRSRASGCVRVQGSGPMALPRSNS